MTTTPFDVSGTPDTTVESYPRTLRRRRTRALLGGVVLLYLVATLIYSILTPAWEANDEAEHVKYAQHLLTERALPPIEPKSGHEAHQPPLYYALLAGWQRVLGVPAFEPRPIPRETAPVIVPGRPTIEPMLSHDYDETQRRHARQLRLIRGLSVLLGGVGVVLTFAAARAVTWRTDVALAAAATVALLPKFNVVSATVTNDALVVPLGALCLLLTARYVQPLRPSGNAVLAVAIGLAFGAATLAKLTCLALVALLGACLFLARTSLAARTRDAFLAAAGFWVVTGWWFLRNWIRYGDPMAGEAAREYLSELIPGLVSPAPWTDEERFLFFVPETLVQSSWYTGGWNQIFAPFAVNLILALLAAIALFAGFRAFVVGHALGGWPLDRRLGVVLGASVAAAIVAVLIVASQTTQAQGRMLYAALPAFAIVAVLGLAEAVGGPPRVRAIALACWPLILLAFNVFVVLRYVLPLRGL